MMLIKQIWQQIVTFFVVFYKTAAVLATIVTLLAFFGIGSATFGYTQKMLPLFIVGIIIFVFSVVY